MSFLFLYLCQNVEKVTYAYQAGDFLLYPEAFVSAFPS
jgi:hypothetical protein